MPRPWSRRSALRTAVLAVPAIFLPRWTSARGATSAKEFAVENWGARGDGRTVDTEAIQRAIDAAAASGGPARVVLRGRRKYLAGGIVLRGGIDFHLADDAELLVSTDPRHFSDRTLLSAPEAAGLRLSGTGRINGRAYEFMAGYEPEQEWWRPGPFRPRLVVFTGCRDLEIRDVTLVDAPMWTVHLVGCRTARVDRVTIRNPLDVPNCDGIDPDHCRDVEIANCRISCGDDPIVIKATRAGAPFGGCENIRVRDCVVETRSAGLKIGTETVAPIRRVRFERCEVRSSCRGLSLQLRDEGSIEDVEFRDIRLVAQQHPSAWWGAGEAISFTAWPRAEGVTPGALRDVRLVHVTARAENSVRVHGSRFSRIRDVRFEGLDLTLDRWTEHQGDAWDNRPTSVLPEFERGELAGVSVRHADKVSFHESRLAWGPRRPGHLATGFESLDSTAVDASGLRGV